ncbi:hypothetical protein [Parasitella parasitica]|uniref:Uncharacterized protein n=1 Tax=Parasitella parasitica TaxID=35722 RepID=A0A0B7NB87_9FUNG|nr:hypothetical protein [Parasitella parasitica]
MSLQEEEQDSLFGFDFDEDDFETKKERVIPEQMNYEAKIETDGWFHDNIKSVDDLMLEQHGPNKLKNAIEHDYFYKRYDKALTLALGYIRVVKTNEQCKVTGTKEITDIAMHCAAKLNRLDTLEELLDLDKSHTQDVGIYLLRAKFYPLVGCYSEALDTCIVYHKARKLDYRIWSIMADVFIKSALRTPIDSIHDDMRYHLANLSMQRAVHIVKTSRWKKNIDFVKRRLEKDLQGLENKLQQTVDQGGNADKFVTWMSSISGANQDKVVATAGLSEFGWQNVVWIYKDWALRQDLDLDDDIKAVKDM